MTDQLSQVVQDVIRERERHVGDLGWTPAHDDRQTMQDWAWLLDSRVVHLQCPFPNMAPGPDRAREFLIEIAAVAIAAAESMDRKEPQ